MKEEQQTLSTAQVNHIYKGVFADVKNEACEVMHQYFVVSYQNFLPVAVLQPIMNRLLPGYKVVLLRNRSFLAYSRAVYRAMSAVSGKRLPLDY